MYLIHAGLCTRHCDSREQSRPPLCPLRNFSPAEKTVIQQIITICDENVEEKDKEVGDIEWAKGDPSAEGQWQLPEGGRDLEAESWGMKRSGPSKRCVGWGPREKPILGSGCGTDRLWVRQSRDGRGGSTKSVEPGLRIIHPGLRIRLTKQINGRKVYKFIKFYMTWEPL